MILNSFRTDSQIFFCLKISDYHLQLKLQVAWSHYELLILYNLLYIFKDMERYNYVLGAASSGSLAAQPWFIAPLYLYTKHIVVE